MLWEDMKKLAEGLDVNTGLVFQEEVQKAVLTALSRRELFNTLVFQGGTALRLFYGNPRFSEDLDFVTVEGRNADALIKNLDHIHDFVWKSYPFLDEVSIKVQKDDELKRLVLKTVSDERDQRLRIHMEVFNVPSYDNGPKILHHRPFYPSVRVESKEEILCDKVVALLGRDYIKGRDLWDVYFLIKERDISVNWELALRKLENYGLGDIKAEVASKRCKDKGADILDNEMKRFLPRTVYVAYKERFDDMVDLSCKLLDTISRRL